MKPRSIPAFLLIAYSAVLIEVMVFKYLPVFYIGSMRFRFGGTHTGPPNFVPFRSIVPYLLGRRGSLIGFVNLAGNILLLVPIGFIVPFVFRSMTWKRALVIAVASGLVIEVMQVIFQVGIFDVDDLILNALGVIIGYWLFRLRPVPSR